MKKLKILVADDDKGIRFVIEQILGSHQVVMASNGKEGLEIFEKTPDFNLLITDRKMPGMLGEELIRRIKLLSPGPSIKIILITSDPENMVAIRKVAYAAGADRVLEKGFALRNLDKEIQCLFPE